MIDTDVYVDFPRHRYGGMIMCHMVSESLEALHAMADKIGIKRKWFQNHGTPHYDICKSKRALAIRHGAIECDRRQIYKIIKFHRGQNG